MNRPNIEFIAYIYILLYISKIKKIFIIKETKQFVKNMNSFLTVLSVCKTEKGNGKREHGQPIDAQKLQLININMTPERGTAGKQSSQLAYK